MTSQVNQDVQDIRITNLEKDVAFYTAVVAMLERAYWRHGYDYHGTPLPGDRELDQQLIAEVGEGRHDPRLVRGILDLNWRGTTYARAQREARRFHGWNRACGLARTQLQEAEEALQRAKAERGY